MHVPLIAHWPGRIPKGTVCADLVDTTDFLPTICEAATIKSARDLKLDGRSFYPQMIGEKGKSREWIYSWYWPRPSKSSEAVEFAFDQRYKLYRTGKFFDRSKDPDEKTPLTITDLTGDAAKSAKSLKSALDQYKDARPAQLR